MIPSGCLARYQGRTVNTPALLVAVPMVLLATHRKESPDWVRARGVTANEEEVVPVYPLPSATFCHVFEPAARRCHW
jgi:hypothetical protein